MNINNDVKDIVELPLTSEEINVLRDIYSKFVVELEAESVSKEKALSVIIKINPKISPRWVLEKFINIDEFQVIKEGEMIFFVFDEDEEVIQPNNDKGGEKMTVKKDFTNKMTSGEEKVAKAVLKKFEEGFKIRSPSRMVFENCLEVAFPRIENGRAATTNLINKGWLKETNGKISIGPEGEKYLSP